MCSACGEAAFPPRLLCPRCGARSWREERIDTAVVERTTERDGTAIATVRTPLGPLLVTRLLGNTKRGEVVGLDADGDVPVATP